VRFFAILANAQQAHVALVDLWQQLKPYLIAEHRFEVEVRPERRNSSQNALLHSLLTEIARSVEWAGKRRDVEVWKRLLTAAWLRARGESVEILPALDGHGVDVVFRRTSDLTIGECADLITFIQAWAVEHDIETMDRSTT
jgi:hypothetical protein